jgi:hypothetical protein
VTGPGPGAPDGGLAGTWAALPPPAGPLLEATAVGDWVGGRVLAAVDSESRRHLLIGVPAGSPPVPGRLRGLEIATRRLRVGGTEGVWVDLVLLDDTARGVFTVLAGEVLDAVREATDPDPGLIGAVITRWRRFWAASADGLSAEARLGLFGELWLLTNWLPGLTEATVRNWRGPLGGRHDFVSETVSVEVKTTGTATGPLLHRVHSLDQLDEPGNGRLYLLSLRVVRDPLGGYTLDGLIRTTRAAAAGAGVADELDDRLAAVGWTPAHTGRYDQRVRVTTQDLYEVRSDFPRLTRGTLQGRLPAAVTDVGYTLDVNACSAWRIEPTEARQSLEPLTGSGDQGHPRP